MNPLSLSFKNITGSPFRSGVIFVCVMLVTGSGMWAFFVTQGAQESLRISLSSMDRSGVDMVVIPRGTGYSSVGMENIDLEGLLEEVTAIPGVSMATPQLRLLTIMDSNYCPEAELYVIAFDPATDFTILSWLPVGGAIETGPGEALVGSLISVPLGEQSITLAGYEFQPFTRLPVTGTSLDQSILVTFETAREMYQLPQDNSGPQVDRSSLPTILVRIHSESETHAVTAQILKDIPGVSVFDSTDTFQLGQNRLSGMLRKIPGLLGITWGLSVLFIGMVFTIAFNERSREIGVLRSLGFTRVSVLRFLLTEGFMLAIVGGLAAILLSLLVEASYRDAIIQSMDLPLVAISPLRLFILVIGSLALTLSSVTLAVLFPAWKISHQDPAITLRG